MPTLPATDLERAKKFYEQKIGLKTIQAMNGSLLMSGGNGTVISIYKRDKPTKADHTVMTFEVTKLESEIKELENKGITFEDYDMPDLKTKNHIAQQDNDKAAWFKDSEGNIICLHENIKK
jgi:predicted enzyme related to lactoylglutathione lyase